MPSMMMRDAGHRQSVLWAGAAAATSLAFYSLLPAADDAVARAPPKMQPQPPAAAPPMLGRAAVPAPAVSTDGLILYGVSGGGPAGMAAIIGRAAASARVVPVGKDYRPGLTVKEVGAAHAILVSAGQETRLDLGGKQAVVAPPPAQAHAALPQGFEGMDAPALRLGLRPRKRDGRISGFELRSTRDLPLLGRAGLQPGDVIVAVNGQAFESEEKLLELPQEIAGSYVAEFEVERDGRRVKLSLPVHERPAALLN